MSFSQRSWGARYAVMGDEAEAKFDALHDAVPFGFNRPPFNIQDTPLVLRHAPDRQTRFGFVECKGVGQDGLLKLKLDQLFALQWWDAIWPVSVFIWDSYRKRHTTLSLATLRKACEKHGALGQFPEGKPIWQIHVEFIPTEWTDNDA